ncbi:MAG: type VI secretion system ATPase TssH [Rhodospirillaceae bacterium]
MPAIKPLIARLSPVCRRALETAAQLCLTRTHYVVEVQHFMIRLAETEDSDADRLLRHFEIDAIKIAAALARSLDKAPRGNVQTPVFSEHLVRLLERAWMIASLRLESAVIGSGAVLAAALDDPGLRGLMLEAAPLLIRLPAGRLLEDLPDLLKASPEHRVARAATIESNSSSGSPALDAYTVDMTAQARAGKIDPIIGRDAEISRIIDILMRRRQNNPILTGEAGVGKTAVVEGFAQAVAKGAVPPSLKEVSVRTLDLGLLQAGASIKGEFEARLKRVIEEVAAAPRPVILFIDEAHTLVGAGGSAGQGDAANLLKPALARGELRTIAATTRAEYKRYFEKDPALARRFQVVGIDEPDENTAIDMLRALVPGLEAHHGVRIFDDAVCDAVRLSHRYISGRLLPDKAVGVLDTACARVALARSGPPAAVQAAARRATLLATEIDMLAHEAVAGRDHADRLDRLADEQARAEDERHRLESRWRQEAEIVGRVQALEQALPSLTAQAGERARLELEGLRLELEQVQDDAPLVPVHVDHQAVAAVVSAWTGIPVGRMLTDTLNIVHTLRRRLGERIIGQDAALDMIARRICTWSAGLGEPGKPTGVFLLAGPSGVGKTETALALAELLFGGQRSLVTINMSEYQEAHSVSGLKGAPPGYIGHGKGGILTEAVRRTPYCVVLLDESEKAHPDVLELFYQVFDKGVLEDSEGVTVDFKNTLILLTSNLGTETICQLMPSSSGDNRAGALGGDIRRAGYGAKLGAPGGGALTEAIRPELVRHFKPALLGRMVVVPYVPLGEPQLHAIIRLKLARIQERFAEAHRADLTRDDEVVSFLAARCRATDAGARAIDHLLTNSLLPELSAAVLDRLSEGQAIEAVHIEVDRATACLRYRFCSNQRRGKPAL